MPIDGLVLGNHWFPYDIFALIKKLDRRDALMHLPGPVAHGVNVPAPPSFAHNLGEGPMVGHHMCGARRYRRMLPRTKKLPRWDHYDLEDGCSPKWDVSTYFVHKKQ